MICIFLSSTAVACSSIDETRETRPGQSTNTSQSDLASETSTSQPLAPILPTPTGTTISTPPSTPTLDPTQVYATPEVPDPTPTQNSNSEPAAGVLPNNRVLSFYGHPNSAQMGVLGEYATKETALAALQQLAAEYETADPSMPVVLAFELIATVAQPDPGADGDYLAETDPEIVQSFVDFTAANDMLLILDLQIGHDTVPNQINAIKAYLKYPNVHVALDPEFSTAASPAVPRNRAPGEFIGEVNGHDINLAIQMLSDFVTQQGLPRKMLIVHQFEDEMIYNKYVITPQPGVDFVLDMDGFGSVESKITTYDQYVQQELIEYGGIKLFFKQDDPLLTPKQVVGLQPPPLVVIYQ